MRRFRLLLAGLGLVGCGGADRVSGGGGIEIPNGLEVAVHDTLGRPVVGARVLVLAEGSWASRLSAGTSPVIDSMTTDAYGNVVVATRDEPVWIEIIGRDGNAARISSRWGAFQNAVIVPRAILDGKIPDGEPKASRMRLAGSAQVAAIDSLGRFSFPAVIQGRYALVAEGVAGRSDRILSGSAVVGSQGAQQIEVHLDTSGLRLDDFSDGDVDWALNDLFGSAFWWLNADVPRDSLPRVFGFSSPTQAVVNVNGERYFSVSVSKAVLNPSWSNFGLDLGVLEGRLPALTTLSAVRFRARGTGVWTLRLATDSAGRERTWIADLPLDTAWSTIRIPASSLSTDFGAVLPSSERLRNLVFQTQGEGRLDVDDVALEGIALDDWVR